MSIEYESRMIIGEYFHKLPKHIKESIDDIDDWCYDNDMERFFDSLIAEFNDNVIGFVLNDVKEDELEDFMELSKVYFKKFKDLTETDARLMSIVDCY